MLVIDSGDAIRGIAEVASNLDYIVNGYIGVTATQLSDGQLGSSEGDLYLSGANGIVVTSITIVNTDSAARTFTLYLKPSGGTSRAITPVSLDLGIGHSLYTDGQRINVMDKNGRIITALGGEAVTLTSPTINGTIATTALTMPAFTLNGTVTGGGNILSNLGTVYIGDTSNTNMTLGLTINQGGATDELIALKGTGITHGYTGLAETDTFASFRQIQATTGGLLIRAFKDSSGVNYAAIQLHAQLAEDVDTTKSTAGRGLIELLAQQNSGNAAVDVVADGNVFVIRSRASGAQVSAAIFDVEGDLWLNGRLTTGGATPNSHNVNQFGGTALSGGASDNATAVRVAMTLTGANADTANLSLFKVGGGIVTQGASENIGVIASAYIHEPNITDNLTGDITVAATLYILDAPDEGETNAAIYVASGDLLLRDGFLDILEITAPGAGATNTARIYALQGAGDALTDLCAVFQDGTVDVFAQETTPLDAPVFTYPSGTEAKLVLRKAHPGSVKIVAVFPNGKEFVLKEIEYHNPDKIAASVGAESSLPQDWLVKSEQQIDFEYSLIPLPLQELSHRPSASLLCQ